MLRWWTDLSAEVHGCDYNGELVRWCQRYLSHAEVTQNTLTPPLPYEDGKFDFVYALSIFTHLSEPEAERWLGELARVIRPGGMLWITVHGEHFADRLIGDQRRRFAAGQIVVQFPELQGTNLCAAFWPGAAVERIMTGRFDVLDRFDPSDPEAKRHELTHDAYLLRAI
jgi:SAM-dependent methyltransferase